MDLQKGDALICRESWDLFKVVEIDGEFVSYNGVTAKGICELNHVEELFRVQPRSNLSRAQEIAMSLVLA